MDTVHEGLLKLISLGADGEVAFAYTVDKLTEWKGGHALEILDTYVEEKGLESFLPWLLRGWFLVKWAWEARSASTIEHVSRNAYVEFRKRLAAANKDLSHALMMSSHGEIFAAMIKVSVGEEWSDEKSLELFQSAVQGTSPLHWAVWSSRLTKVTAKWGGSHEEMFSLVSNARQAPEGHYLHALAALAHAERYLFFSMDEDQPEEVLKIAKNAYFGQQAVVTDIQAAYRAFHGTDATPPREQQDRAHQLFAIIFWKMWKCSGKREDSFADIARRELALVQSPVNELGHEWSWITGRSKVAAHNLVCADLGI